MGIFYSGNGVETMRAVVLGLAGVVLAIGGAQAADCKLDGLELVAKEFQASDITRPDLVGKAFRVARASSSFKRIASPAEPDATSSDDGSVYALIEGNGETFTINQQYNGHALPRVMGISSSGSNAQGVNWGRRSRAAEATRFDGNFDIYEGPLAGLTLEPTNCK